MNRQFEVKKVLRMVLGTPMHRSRDTTQAQ